MARKPLRRKRRVSSSAAAGPVFVIAGRLTFDLDAFLRDASPGDVFELSPEQAEAVRIAILEWSRLRSKIRDDKIQARQILTETRNPSAALRVFGITKGEAGKGRTLAPQLLLAIYESLLRGQQRVRVQGGETWVDLRLFNLAGDDTKDPFPEVSVRVECEPPLEPDAAVRAVALYQGVKPRRAWEILNAERKRLEAAGHPPSQPLPRRPR